MKKYLLAVITLMVLGVGSASAQAVWGGRIGVSKPTASTNEGESIDGKFGLELGPVLYYGLKNNFYINTGAMFSIKQFDYNYDYSYYGGSYGYGTLSMFYLDVPLYAGYRFPINNLSFYAQAGPYVGFKLSESGASDIGGSGFNSFNAGLGFMAGINLKRFKIEVGYQAGLANVVADASDGFSAHLSSLFLGVSYIF